MILKKQLKTAIRRFHSMNPAYHHIRTFLPIDSYLGFFYDTVKMKRVSIYILAVFFKGLVILYRRITSLLIKPLVLLMRFLLASILPFYEGYTHAKRLFIKFYSPFQKKHRLIHPFARRYTIHVLIIILSLFVTSSNLNAVEIKTDDIGYSNILSHIASGEELGTIYEEGPLKQEESVMHYLNRSSVQRGENIDFDAMEEFYDTELITSGGVLVKPILSPTEIALRKRDTIIDYIVQEGDTVSGIAQKFGVSINTILWENNLNAYTIIRPGQKLTILPVTGLRHTVQKGDTLSKIAKTYSSSVEEIIQYNKLASADDLQIGEKLIIPGGKKPQVVRTYSLQKWTPTIISTLPQKPVSQQGKFLWPSTCRTITQYYSWRHYGIDIACGYGRTIRAAQGGRVIKTQGGWNGGYGIMIIIEHENGIQTLYAHLSNIYVNVGDIVHTGQAIGAEGSTGRSSGPHLHFEVRSGGRRLNPLSYL